jgi:hypothetical protein
MNKLKHQLEFLYLQIESIDELAFQAMKPKHREMQIRTMVMSAAMIIVRTSADEVSYANIEHCNVLIDEINKTIFQNYAAALNRAYEIKKQVGKYGEVLTQDRLTKLITETVDTTYSQLLEVFASPEKFIPGVNGKGGMA